MQSSKDIKNHIHPGDQTGREHADLIAALASDIELLSFEEQEELEAYSRHLIEEANALFLSLQKKYNGVLGADEFDTGELHDLETEYRVKLRAIQRMHRRFEAWEWIHKTVERARKRLEQAQSEFVN